MKHYYLGFLFLFLYGNFQAQDTDVKEEIMTYSETKEELISKGRRLLRDKLIEGDYAKVKEVKDYLLRQAQDENYIALHPGEQLMLMFWTAELEDLPRFITSHSQESLNQWYQNRILPNQDMLYHKIIEQSWEQLSMLEDKILASSLPASNKDFLLLYLNFMVSGEPLMKINQETVNDMADLYLKTHPESKYEEFIRNNIRFKIAPSNWGLGFEFFSGFGMPTDELGDMYNSHGVFGVAFDVEFKKITLYLRNYIGFAKTKQDREEAGVLWSKNSNSHIFLPEASFGYAVLDNDKIKLSPFVGIGGASVGPVTSDIDKRPELEEMEVGFSPAYSIGLNLNIKLGWETAPYITQKEDKSYWFVRIRYGYTMPQFNDYTMHSGSVHQITIGLGGLYRGIKRDL